MSGSDDRNEPQASTYHRRASFSPGTTLTELFTGRSVPPPYPGPNVTAAQRARRVSISGPSVNGIASNPAFRRGSVSSINSSASNLDENVVDEGEGSPAGVPTSPFMRRMSFGARALRLPGKLGTQGSPVTSPTASRGTWPDNGKSNQPQVGENPHHQRRPSVSTMPLPVTAISANKEQIDHDPLQERILKGDFYMD
ncbi:hypothetical protein BDZ91DRAFT_659965 [Kalaharituber pfeilii]|nr:hypothetical protein BDZ91DRAFT_659965 [Kalaharituber pfeilii]